MKVFVVDDYVPVLKCVAAMLQAMGHSVVTFSDPGLAMASLTTDVDLVLSDINMPGIDGFEVARLAALKLGKSSPRTLLPQLRLALRSDIQERHPRGLSADPVCTLPAGTVRGVSQWR